MRISAEVRIWAGRGQGVVVWLWSLGREKEIDVREGRGVRYMGR
jgi:hypothetical protein